MRVELADGNSAELLDTLDGITNDERDSIEFAYAEATGPEGATEVCDIRRLKALNRRIIELAVTSWTLGKPLPGQDPGVLGSISAGDGRALEEAAWKIRYTTDPVDTTLAGAEGEDGELRHDAPFLPSTP